MLNALGSLTSKLGRKPASGPVPREQGLRFHAALDDFEKIAGHREEARAAAVAAFDRSRAELGARAADRGLCAFLEPLSDKPLTRVERYLQDYTQERLWVSPQKEIYGLMLEQDWFGDYPQKFTQMLLKEVPGISLSERVATFKAFLEPQHAEALSHHDTKLKAYSNIVELHRRGADWKKAQTMVLGLVAQLPEGERGKYWQGAHAMNHYLPSKLYKSDNAALYLRILDLGYQRDWPAVWLEKLKTPVSGTSQDGRADALQQLTATIKPWFEQPEEVGLAYDAWAARLDGGGDPKPALAQACSLADRLRGRNPREATEATFKAFSNLRGEISAEAFSAALETDPLHGMLGLEHRDRPSAAAALERLLRQTDGVESKVEAAARFSGMLARGLEPDAALQACYRQVFEAPTDDTEVLCEVDYLLVGDHPLPRSR